MTVVREGYQVQSHITFWRITKEPLWPPLIHFTKYSWSVSVMDYVHLALQLNAICWQRIRVLIVLPSLNHPRLNTITPRVEEMVATLGFCGSEIIMMVSISTVVSV
jgi:hypothetical protein